MPRNIQDSSTQVKVSTALPNAGNTKSTSGIDLGAATPFPLTESIGVLLTSSAATAANSKNINISVQHSIDNNVSNYANISELSTWVVTGNATAHAAATRDVTLPPATKRWIRAIAVGESDGGDASDGTITCQLVF